MSQGNVVATLLLVCQGFQVVFLRGLFVSHSGKDASFCGNSSLPCRSIRFAVNMSNTGDVIFIDYARGKPYTECEYSSSRSQTPIVISKALSFIGIKGKPVIHCRPSRDLFKITGYTSNQTRIAFGNLIISKTYLAIRLLKTNFELTLERCVLSKVHIGIYINKETHCSIRIFNSNFEDSSLGIYTKCTNLEVHLTFVSFALSPVFLYTIYDQQKHGAHNKKTEVFISNCDFNGKRQRSICAELLRIIPFPVLVNITISYSRFANHNGECQSKGSITGALFISADNFHHGEKALINLNKLQVENNYTPLSAVHLIFNPDFINTSIPNAFKVEILNSVFRNNTGSLVVGMRTSLRAYRFTFNGPSILLSNNTFLENNYFKGAEREIAPGIKFINGRYRVVSCRFRDNIPGDLPDLAVLSISDFAVVKFKNCHYENTQLSGSSAQVYAMPNSILQFEDSNTFDMIALKTNQATFIHMPSATKGTGKLGKIVLKGTLRIKCPPGFSINTKSQFQVIRSQRAWTYLYSLCEQCPPKTYSLARGELRDNITYKIQCHVCPRGGHCERGQVMAKPNFWGYKKNGKLSFLACPPKYCCDTENCKTYDGCRGNRTGILCGQCPEGWSEPLFNAKCKLNEECTDWAFWPGVLITLILYLVFFLYQKEIAMFVRKSLFPKFRFRIETSNDNVQTCNEQIRPQNSQIYQPKGSGLLKIIFYYYQIVHLFRNCVNSREKQNVVVLKLEGVFSKAMNLIVINLSSFDCPFHNLRAVQKTAFLHSKGYCLLAFLGFVFLFTKCLNVVIKRFRNVTESQNQCAAVTSFETTNNTKKATSPFSVRIISAFTRISLVMYASSTQLCLSLLHCVLVGDTSVLFIDGTIKCYQTFQYFLLAYVVLSILPFCLVPVLGSYLLMFNSISVSQFCVACVFPLPFCCYWIYLFKKSHSRQYTSIEIDQTTEDIDSVACPSGRAVLTVLSGPFRHHKPFLCFPASPLPWEGFLIFRRLILIVVLTFIPDNRLRLIVALVICVAILILHMYVKPFIIAWQNLLETLSLGTLIILCGFTLVQALYVGEDFSSLDSAYLLNVLDMVESFLIISPLAIIIFLVMLSLLVRLIFAIRFCIHIFVRRSRCCCK